MIDLLLEVTEINQHMTELVSAIIFGGNDLDSPNFVCHLIYESAGSSLYMGHLDLHLKVTECNTCSNLLAR